MRFLARAAIVAAASLPTIVPIAAAAQDAPSYAAGGYASGDEQIHGRIVAFNGAYEVTVRDDRGFLDHVELHQGTIINPTGLRLEPGMVVSINGYNAGSAFDANEIDTPYTFYAGVPYYQNHPWTYFGAGVGLGFFFGSLGWWHGGYYGTPYAYNGGIRLYHTAFYGARGYYGGGFAGRAYVASPVNGGYYHHFDGYDRGVAPGAVGNYRGRVPGGYAHGGRPVGYAHGAVPGGFAHGRSGGFAHGGGDHFGGHR